MPFPAADARIVLPSQCRQGSCGACYADVTSGDYVLGEHNPAALPAGAAEHGGILLCRTFPFSYMSVSLPFDHDLILLGEIRRRESAIAGIEPVGENTVRLTLLLAPDDDGSVAEFEPGQFMELEVPEQGIRRTYSLPNTDNWEGRLEFLIRLQPGGLLHLAAGTGSCLAGSWPAAPDWRPCCPCSDAWPSFRSRIRPGSISASTGPRNCSAWWSWKH